MGLNTGNKTVETIAQQHGGGEEIDFTVEEVLDEEVTEINVDINAVREDESEESSELSETTRQEIRELVGMEVNKLTGIIVANVIAGLKKEIPSKESYNLNAVAAAEISPSVKNEEVIPTATVKVAEDYLNILREQPNMGDADFIEFLRTVPNDINDEVFVSKVKAITGRK